MAKSRQRVPKLLQEILTAVFFFVALIATIMLVLGLSVSGALASSGIVIAVVGFAIRNVVADTLSGIALGLEAPYRIGDRSEEHTSELQSLMRISYAGFCLKQKTTRQTQNNE